MRQSISFRGFRSQNEEKFSYKHLPAKFASLPRVLHLVWSTSPLLTIMMGLLSLLQGFTPALNVSISAFLIDSVVRAITTRGHRFDQVWLAIILQLSITLFSSLLSTLSNIVQQLLQEQVSNRVLLDILKKANTLELAFFENPESND